MVVIIPEDVVAFKLSGVSANQNTLIKYFSLAFYITLHYYLFVKGYVRAFIRYKCNHFVFFTSCLTLMSSPAGHSAAARKKNLEDDDEFELVEHHPVPKPEPKHEAQESKGYEEKHIQQRPHQQSSTTDGPSSDNDHDSSNFSSRFVSVRFICGLSDLRASNVSIMLLNIKGNPISGDSELLPLSPSQLHRNIFQGDFKLICPNDGIIRYRVVSNGSRENVVHSEDASTQHPQHLREIVLGTRSLPLGICLVQDNFMEKKKKSWYQYSSGPNTPNALCSPSEYMASFHALVAALSGQMTVSVSDLVPYFEELTKLAREAFLPNEKKDIGQTLLVHFLYANQLCSVRAYAPNSGGHSPFVFARLIVNLHVCSEMRSFNAQWSDGEIKDILRFQPRDIFATLLPIIHTPRGGLFASMADAFIRLVLDYQAGVESYYDYGGHGYRASQALRLPKLQNRDDGVQWLLLRIALVDDERTSLYKGLLRKLSVRLVSDSISEFLTVDSPPNEGSHVSISDGAWRHRLAGCLPSIIHLLPVASLPSLQPHLPSILKNILEPRPSNLPLQGKTIRNAEELQRQAEEVAEEFDLTIELLSNVKRTVQVQSPLLSQLTDVVLRCPTLLITGIGGQFGSLDLLAMRMLIPLFEYPCDVSRDRCRLLKDKKIKSSKTNIPVMLMHA